MLRRGLQSELRAIAALVFVSALGACDPYPRDPGGTLEEAMGRTLVVGVTEAPPLLTRSGGDASGPEAELVEAFAASIGARVEWRWDLPDRNLVALEGHELDVVAAGLEEGSPWKERVALTRPWRVEGDRRYVLAVPRGENQTLVALERLIEARKAGAR